MGNAELAERETQIRETSVIGKRNFRAAGIDADAIIDVAEKLQMHLTAITDAHFQREHQLLAALENAELIAIGYAIERGAAAKLELVPAFLFQRQFLNLQKSEFGDGECRFAKVRIAPASALQNSRIGRPSIRGQVFEIAKAIEDQLKGLKPGEQATVVHRYGQQKFPQTFTSENSPTNRAIDRHLKSYWESK